MTNGGGDVTRRDQHHAADGIGLDGSGGGIRPRFARGGPDDHDGHLAAEVDPPLRVEGIVQIIFFLVLARVIMSWLPMITNKPLDYSNPLVKFLIDITEPLLAPLRRYLIVGVIDLSPMVLLISLGILAGILADNA